MLNPSDIHSDDDDIVDTRIPTQAELSHLDNTLNTPISHPLNPFTASDKQITQQEYDDISHQTIFELHSLLLQPPPDFYPLTSLFDLDPNKYLDFFVPPSEHLTFDLILEHQKSDFVLMIIRKWLTSNDKPLYKTANITGNKGLNHYYDRLEYLSIHPDSELLYFTYYKENTYNPNPITLICLPIKLLLLVFYQAHHHNLSGHYGLDRTYNNFASHYYFPSLRKWLRLLIYDCIPCQTQKSSRMDINTATQIPFASTANNFNHRISMDTKGPIFPKSKDNNYIFVICDAFSHFVITQPTPLNDAETATEVLLKKWIIPFGPPEILVTDKGPEYFNSTLTNFCTYFGIKYRPRHANEPWANGLVESQNKHLGRFIRNYLQPQNDNWSDQAEYYAFAHNTQVLSKGIFSPYELVFKDKPRVPLSFHLEISRSPGQICSSPFCSFLPTHLHNNITDQNPLIHSHLRKPLTPFLLRIERNMLYIYSQQYLTVKERQDSQSAINQRLGKAYPLQEGTFVLHRNFKTNPKFSKKLQPLKIGPYKIIKKLTAVNYELISPKGETLISHRNHLIPYRPISPHLEKLIDSYKNISSTSKLTIIPLIPPSLPDNNFPDLPSTSQTQPPSARLSQPSLNDNPFNINIPPPDSSDLETQDNNYSSSPPLFPDTPPTQNPFDSGFDPNLSNNPTSQISQPRTIRLSAPTRQRLQDLYPSVQIVPAITNRF